MKSHIIRMARQPKHRYVWIGGSVYVLELLIILLAQHMGVAPTGAVALSFCVGTATSFALQKVVTFGDKRKHKKVIAAQLVAYGLLLVWNFLFTIVLTALLERWIPTVVIRTVALGITTIWNYYLYKTHIFAEASATKKRRKRSKKKQTARQVVGAYVTKAMASAWLPRSYMAISLLVLFGSAAWWAQFGASLHQLNADQLVDPYLFEDTQTLREATFPAAHTFLLKWPLFWLIGHFGFSALAFSLVTVAVVVVTLAALVWWMYKIEHRPFVFGTLCLALAAVLCMVPAAPYAGALLPVNLAMLATRNLEYIVYILALRLLVRSGSWRDGRFWASAIVLGLLFASDKLFATFSVGGALIMLAAYSLLRIHKLTGLAVRWLAASLVGLVIGRIMLAFVNTLHVAHIANTFSASPYQLVRGVHDIVLGLIHLLLSLFTNFGANPIGDTRVLSTFTAQALATLRSGEVFIIVVNGLALAVSSWAVWFHVRESAKRSLNNQTKLGTTPQLAVMLVASTLVACGAFVGSVHYYPVDARYTTIALFAGCIAAASWLRTKRIADRYLLRIGAVIGLSIIFAVPSILSSQHQQKTALNIIDRRNHTIVQAVKAHKVDVVVGDYWRVVPLRSIAGQSITVTPLADCTTPLTALSSKAWQPDLRTHSFAYLLSFDQKLTNYPVCSPDQVIATFGEPNATVIVAGNVANPKELLLFYDQGVQAPADGAATGPRAANLFPISLQDMPEEACEGQVDMNIVAHEDDDLLFMNPAVIQAVQAGHCQHTIYVTAGDAGADKFYWLKREQGSEAAYGQMLGDVQQSWTHRTVQLGPKAFATVAVPKNHPHNSLIFLHLPDGALQGSGFPASHFQSLLQLEQGSLPFIQSVDGQSAYTKQQLQDALGAFMRIYRPALVRTQADDSGQSYADHEDHVTVGQFAARAFSQYQADNESTVAVLENYMGYPMRELPENISGPELDSKAVTFFSYARFDMAVCASFEQCQDTAYSSYLPRMYMLEAMTPAE